MKILLALLVGIVALLTIKQAVNLFRRLVPSKPVLKKRSKVPD